MVVFVSQLARLPDRNSELHRFVRCDNYQQLSQEALDCD